MSSTLDDLKEAFAGESQANRKYLAFARKAEQDGHPQAARLFRAVAEAETVHALSHLRAMGGIGGTADNLKNAVEGEVYEFKSMYPPMIERAKAAGEKQALRSFEFAKAVEEIHAGLYQKMLDGHDGSDAEQYPYFVCPVCGHTAERGAPDTCPICGAKGSSYIRID